MQQVMLDTNFILSCARQKIDFFEEIPLMGFEILIPRQVFKEIENLSKSRESALVREEASLALKLLNRNKFTLMKLDYNYVDKGIRKFAKENPEAIIATLDKQLQDTIENKKMIIREKKKLIVI